MRKKHCLPLFVIALSSVSLLAFAQVGGSPSDIAQSGDAWAACLSQQLTSVANNPNPPSADDIMAACADQQTSFGQFIGADQLTQAASSARTNIQNQLNAGSSGQ